MTARLEVHELCIGYRSPLTQPLNFGVDAGEVLSVLGPSGSGKSTLLATIAGVQPALSGRVEIDGVDVTDAAIQQRNVGLVFQDPLLFPQYDVAGNVRYGLLRHGWEKRAASARAMELLGWVGLAGLEHRNVHELSGGQAQRVALARAIAPRPNVLLLDEPFSALDTQLRQRLADDVVAIAKEQQLAVVHVTHDADEARRICDRSVVLNTS